MVSVKNECNFTLSKNKPGDLCFWFDYSKVVLKIKSEKKKHFSMLKM